MSYSEKMFKYNDGSYRFISHEKLKIGDEVKIATDANGQPIIKVVKKISEQRTDGGKWGRQMFTNRVYV